MDTMFSAWDAGFSAEDNIELVSASCISTGTVKVEMVQHGKQKDDTETSRSRGPGSVPHWPSGTGQGLKFFIDARLGYKKHTAQAAAKGPEAAMAPKRPRGLPAAAACYIMNTCVYP